MGRKGQFPHSAPVMQCYMVLYSVMYYSHTCSGIITSISQSEVGVAS